MRLWLLLQRAIALSVLVALAPLLAVLVLAVRLDSPGPGLYVATRVGRQGKLIRIHKIRSMHDTGDKAGPAITSESDPRITRAGRWLRARRLDELPQLWDVVCGRMALVGPRPEDPAFVDVAEPAWRIVLSVLPGITGRAQLQYHDEAAQLAGEADDAYRVRILPGKLAVDLEYVRSRSVRTDLRILLDTGRFVLDRS